MHVVILGCGRVGALLAKKLSQAGNSVTMIDRNSDSFRRLGKEFSGEVVVGVGIDEDVQRRAGIEQADIFIAATNGDNTNVMASQVAKVIFSVPKVITRIYDPERAIAYKEFGLETICSTTIMADLMMQRITNEAT